MKTILSFGAHPDDIEIGCGGTERKLIEQGYQATHVYVTSGEAGSMTIDKSTLAEVREAEARSAAKTLGVDRLEFLRAPDGLTSYTRELKVAAIDLIREIRPEVVFLHASSDRFPDHHIVHDLVVAAIAGAAGPWYQESTGEPHAVQTILGYEVWHPLNQCQLTVDISSVIDIKLAALKCHESQIGPTHYDEAFLGLARYRGVMGFKGKYAEAFEVIKIGEAGLNICSI